MGRTDQWRQRSREVPPNLFYGPANAGPRAGAMASSSAAATAVTPAAAVAGPNPIGDGNGGSNYTQLLTAAARQQHAELWSASGQESYMLEEKDVVVPMHDAMSIWMPDQRPVRRYVMGQ